MNNIVLVTVLPGLYNNHDRLMTFNTVNYENWLKVNRNWQKHTGQKISVISDLHMITLQYKDILIKNNLLIFSETNWNDLGSSLIQTNFYVHLALDMYTHAALSERSASDNVLQNISNLSRWNNNCCRLRDKDINRSFILNHGEFLSFKLLQLFSIKSANFSVNTIENLNLLEQSTRIQK